MSEPAVSHLWPALLRVWHRLMRKPIASPRSDEAIELIQAPGPIAEESEPELIAPVPLSEPCRHFDLTFEKATCPIPHDLPENRQSELWAAMANHADESYEARQSEYITRSYYCRCRTDRFLRRDPWFQSRYSAFNEDHDVFMDRMDRMLRYLKARDRAARDERIARMSADAVVERLREERIIP